MESKIQERLKYYKLDHLSEKDYKLLNFKVREEITFEGDTIDYLLIILNGKAKITRLASNGEHHILCYYVSDGVIGDLEFLTNSNRVTTTCIALSEIKTIKIPYDILYRELDHNIEFLKRLSFGAASKALDDSDVLVSMAMESGESRLAAYIMQGAYKNVFVDNLSDVARSIGVSYRHLFRLLNKFIEENILSKIDDTYVIVDEKKLQNIIKG